MTAACAGAEPRTARRGRLWRSGGATRISDRQQLRDVALGQVMPAPGGADAAEVERGEQPKGEKQALAKGGRLG